VVAAAATLDRVPTTGQVIEPVSGLIVPDSDHERVGPAVTVRARRTP
jgi:hypothetical protein